MSRSDVPAVYWDTALFIAYLDNTGVNEERATYVQALLHELNRPIPPFTVALSQSLSRNQ
jgi:hypothetical protein